MINLFFQNTSIESYWDLSNPIVLWGMLLIPIMYFVIGLRIILKYFITIKRKELIYFGLTLIFLGCFWWNNFSYALSEYILIPESMYYILSIGMFPIATLLWIYSCFYVTSPRYKKPVLIISFVTFILYEIFFWTALFYAPHLIGEIKGGFYWYPSIFIIILLVVLSFLSACGLIAIAKETLRSEDLNVLWKGRFLLIAFFSLAIGGLIEIAIPFSVLSFVSSRIILLSASIEFYFAFFLPKILFKKEKGSNGIQKATTNKNQNKSDKETVKKKNKLSKIISSILLLSLFFFFPFNPFTDTISFLRVATLYLALTNLIIYWDFGKALIQDFQLEVPMKEKIILYSIAINSFVLLISLILEIFIVFPNFFYVFSNPLYLIIFFIIYVFGLLNTYIIKFSNLKKAWTGSTFPTQEEIVTKGYYKLCRHPIYFFSFFMFGGVGFFLNTWWSLVSSLIIIICYAMLGKCEERYFESNPTYKGFQAQSPYTPFGWFNPVFLKKRKAFKNKNEI